MQTSCSRSSRISFSDFINIYSKDFCIMLLEQLEVAVVQVGY